MLCKFSADQGFYQRMFYTRRLLL